MTKSSNYWYKGYHIENIPSKALENLLSKVNDYYFNKSIDIGCGIGRNIPLLLRKSNDITAIDNNQYAIKNVKKKFKHVNAYTLDILDLSKLFHKEFDFGLAWRVLHLGDDMHRKKTIKNIVNIMKNGSYIAIAVSSRGCLSYKQKILKGAKIISPGTIFRINDRNIEDTRHYFTEKEVEESHPQLYVRNMFKFNELSGDGKHSKEYIAALMRLDN